MQNDDLCEIDDLNENTVVDVLEQRYFANKIYTRSGVVFLAVNPYTRMDSCVNGFANQCFDEDREVVHVYSVAESCYRDFSVHGDQTIVISGESGSGKTENAKLMIDYLLRKLKSEMSIHEGIAAANTVLEAFGNACTRINDNSSRFGKRIKLLFNGDTSICGAVFETYLLEKSRVTHHEQGEKNFHVFYQLCAAHHLFIKNDFIDTSSMPNTIELEDYAKEYAKVFSSIEQLEIQNAKQIEKYLIGILYLGSVDFVSDGILKVVRNDCFVEFCRIYGIDEDLVEEVLVKLSIQVKGETIEVFNTQAQAITIRNSMARLLYSSIFNYITLCINNRLRGKCGVSSISVLDIFGFEAFKSNGLDQFCINWTNEKIQSEFVRKILNEKQDNYKSEGIVWKSIEHKADKECIVDIEKPCGLADLISEESQNSWGSAANLGTKIKNYLGASIKTAVDDKIIVSHYAGDVEYDLKSFIEKNKEKGNLKIFTNMPIITDDNSKGDLVRYFKHSMNELLSSIGKTQVKYIKCLKPNLYKKPGVFDRALISKQLFECGILQAIRISKQCFAQEMLFETFQNRYSILGESAYGIVSVIKGASKCFMSNQTLDILENCRSHAYKECFRIIRVSMRAYLKKHSQEKRQKITFVNENEYNNEPVNPASAPVVIECDDMMLKDEESVVAGCSGIDIDDKCIHEGETHRTYSEIIKDLELKIEQYKRFCEAPCRSCKSLEMKYRFQSEALKKKNMVELELEKYKARVEDLERKLSEKEGEDEESQISVSFTNSYNIFSCLIQLYLEFAPSFPNEEVPRPEMLSLAHSAFYVVSKLDRDAFETSFGIIDEIYLKLHLFERNIHKISFILSNLIEYQSILRGEDVFVEEIESLISILFKHLCELQRVSVLEVLPHAIVEHQQLSIFKCNEGYLKKIFKPPHVSKLIRLLEYFHHQMLYYHIPEPYIIESANYLLKIINASVFNEILVRKNFLSFNRGVQINYNINEIDKFCRSINYSEGMFNLSHITSIIKLINLIEARATADNILDECSILNCMQINEIVERLDSDASYHFGEDNRDDRFVQDPTISMPNYTSTSRHAFICPRYIPSESLMSILKSMNK
ncbi:myosin [Ordospora pajunii]|uniref:myosin n=1 Tax=Ordospora pajunii TaxID=3039483 RepID=UPI0029526FB7|nr:myosin [Ordospora pajunii]KAH9410768.1 myosin [Ordospora pajunii]